jgi:hypothetical protein
MGGVRCVTIYRFFGAEEMDFGSQRSPTSKYDFELEKSDSMPCRANRFEPIGMASELLGAVLPILPSDHS